MNAFKVGETVRVTGTTMTGNVGTVVYLYTDQEKYLVRFTDETQNYFTEDELEVFAA